MKNKIKLTATAILSMLMLAACGSETIEPQWAKVSPGGDSLCGDGSEFNFWQKTGAPDNTNLLVVVEGGGACWDAATCGIGTGSTSISEGRSPDNDRNGVFDLENENNPFKDWSMVFVPYCTADIHWGDLTTQYSDTLTIHHNGYNNLMAVLSWVGATFEEPETVFITGESAGAYGARLFAANAMENYADTNTRFVTLADSGNGVITKDWLLSSFLNWGAYEIRPDWLPEFYDIPLADLDMQVLDIALANYYPQHQFAEFNTYRDSVQKLFYGFMGGKTTDWTDEMISNVSEVEIATTNYHHYTGGGNNHTIMSSTGFFDVIEDDVAFYLWVTDLVNGADVGNVGCGTDWACRY